MFDRAAKGEVVLEVPTLIVAEAYYRLVSFCEVERKVAAGKLAMLLQQHGVKLRDASLVLTALGWLQTSRVGFADAYLAAASEEKLTVASFDADFDKLRVTRYEPTV